MPSAVAQEFALPGWVWFTSDMNAAVTAPLPYRPQTIAEQCIGCDDPDKEIVALHYGEPYCADCACADGCEHFHPGDECPVVEQE